MSGSAPVSAWDDAALGAALFAVDPAGVGGVVLRGLPGPARDRWLAMLRALLPASAPLRRVPLHVTDGRLLGGLDLAATLRAGRPVAERGLLVEADGGAVLLAMAERLAPSVAARLGGVLDSKEVALERDGLTLRSPTCFGVVALDEGLEPDEQVPEALRERLAFHLDLSGIGARDAVGARHEPDAIDAARARLPGTSSSPEIVHTLCAAAMALGISSIRAPLLALRTARAAAALAGRSEVSEEDVTAAARLVLAPRATAWPAAEPAAEDDDPEPSPSGSECEDGAPRSDEDPERSRTPEDGPLDERLLSAAKAALPAGLLSKLRLGGSARARAKSSGRAGAHRHGLLRGRPAGVRRGEPGAGARLNVVETLRSAAPWQVLRRREADATHSPRRRRPRVEVRRDDFRVTRFRQRSETTTIFVVDASGSTALHRLAEAKGAVERLLAECYVRRDRVALVAFRGRGAELLLPPTRSLLRAKRSLAGLPGGGGTPLAAGIEAAEQLAESVRRRGGTPLIVLLTDGNANVARDGTGGRTRASEDATGAARRLRAAELGVLLVDTSPRPRPPARELAREMNATYLPLPHADSAALCDAVQESVAPTRRRATRRA